jgi:hypothetical protein
VAEATASTSRTTKILVTGFVNISVSFSNRFGYAHSLPIPFILDMTFLAMTPAEKMTFLAKKKKQLEFG